MVRPNNWRPNDDSPSENKFTKFLDDLKETIEVRWIVDVNMEEGNVAPFLVTKLGPEVFEGYWAYDFPALQQDKKKMPLFLQARCAKQRNEIFISDWGQELPTATIVRKMNVAFSVEEKESSGGKKKYLLRYGLNNSDSVWYPVDEEHLLLWPQDESDQLDVVAENRKCRTTLPGSGNKHSCFVCKKNTTVKFAFSDPDIPTDDFDRVALELLICAECHDSYAESPSLPIKPRRKEFSKLQKAKRG